MKRHLAIAAAMLFAVGCSSSAPQVQSVNPKEPRRVVGTESGVRVDAELYEDTLQPASLLPFKYEITNHRDQPIAIAEMSPVATFDPDTEMVTINVGSEVPGTKQLPRLITIAAGEKRAFSANARVNIVLPRRDSAGPLTRLPRTLQIRVNFLGDVAPFAQLTNITEKAVHDPQLTEELFPKWLEGNESVITNSLPMHWTSFGESNVSRMQPPRRPRRRG